MLQPHGELDTAYYVTLSQRVAAEGVFAPIGAFFVSPLYVYFLAAVFAAGGSLLAAQLVQIVLGAVAVGLLFATARHWFGERAALVGAGLAILTGIFAFNEVLILQSALDPFLVSCALYALTRTMAGGGTGAFAAAGASLGLLALNRPNALVFAVAAAAVAFVSQCFPPLRPAEGRRRKGRVNRGAVLVTSLLAVLAANAARNYAVSGDAVVIASHGGLNLYIGNHDRADGTYTPVPGITPSIAGQANDSTRVAEASTGRSLSPGEVSSYFAWRAFDWVTGHPAEALRLWIRKIRILLNRVDVPLNYSYAFYAREPFSFLRVLAVGPWLLLPLGLLGLFWPALRRTAKGIGSGRCSSRLRSSGGPLLCDGSLPDASVRAAVRRGWRRARSVFRPGARPPVQRAPASNRCPRAASLVVFSNLGLDNGIGGEQTRKAVWLVEQGSFDEARRYVEQVSHDHLHPGVLRFSVAQALLDAGRPDEAAALLVEANRDRRPATCHPARARRSADQDRPRH